MDPLFNSRGDIQIYLDLCEKAGLLLGEGGYLDHINQELGLSDPHKLPLDRKPTVREIFDNWAKAKGYADGIAFFEQNGVSKEPVAAQSFYGLASDPPFEGIRLRLYGESLKRYSDQMKALGVEQLYWQDYTPLPTWRTPNYHQSPLIITSSSSPISISSRNRAGPSSCPCSTSSHPSRDSISTPPRQQPWG